MIATAEDERATLHAIAHALVHATPLPAELEQSVGGRGIKSMRPTYGRTELAVTIETEREHHPYVAMALAGFILYGFEWGEAFDALELPGHLVGAYEQLDGLYGTPLLPTPRIRRKAREGSPERLEGALGDAARGQGTSRPLVTLQSASGRPRSRAGALRSLPSPVRPALPEK